MILQALYEYYQRLAHEDQNTVQEGFEKREIPFLVVISPKGEFRDLQDTRQGEGNKKRGRVFTVPKAVKRSSGIAANLLWDNPVYVFRQPKASQVKITAAQAKRSRDQHEAFIQQAESLANTNDQGLLAVLSFLKTGAHPKVFTHSLWEEIAKSGANISFQLEGDNILVCQRPAIINQITISNTKNIQSNEDGVQCLITGEIQRATRLHSSIKGVWGAQSSGANIVSFNLPAFNSYAKTQGYNAPVCQKAEFSYTTALNTLLARNSRQRVQVGDASTVFWAARDSPMEDIFAELFGEAADGETAQDSESIKALYGSPVSGAPPLDSDLTPFYVLGLAPNISRIAIRFWHAGTVSEVARNIRQYFDDVAIVHSSKQVDHLPLFRLLISTAVQSKSSNIMPKLAGDIMKSILTGMPYPRALIGTTINRIRADHEISYPRAALVKAVLCRDFRFYNKQGKEVGMSLDTENTNAGYRLGRLFAVLERAQERANPNVNATIRDRFYGAASSTPIVAFPHLLKLKNHHIAKLENKGEAVNLEKLIGEIMDSLSDFPPNLNLSDQGRFAIGYYHQRQNFFAKQ